MLDAFLVFGKAGLDRRQTKAILKGKQTLTAVKFAEICKVLKVSTDTFAVD